MKLATWGVSLSKNRKGGWVVYGVGTEEVWVRKGEAWGVWWRRVRGVQRAEEEVVVDGEDGDSTVRQRKRSWWGLGRGGSRSFIEVEEEERPLLD